jgi:predicted metal-dependent hydrolase
MGRIVTERRSRCRWSAGRPRPATKLRTGARQHLYPVTAEATFQMTVRPNHHGVDFSADFSKGLDLFNRAHFFDAHEVLEDVWRSVPDNRPDDQPVDQPMRRHLQGMVQLAVAFHHESTGNNVGAHSVLERALRNLNGAEHSLPNVDLDRLRADLAPWRRYLEGQQVAADSATDVATDVATDIAGDARGARARRPSVLPRIALRR